MAGVAVVLISAGVLAGVAGYMADSAVDAVALQGGVVLGVGMREELVGVAGVGTEKFIDSPGGGVPRRLVPRRRRRIARRVAVTTAAVGRVVGVAEGAPVAVTAGASADAAFNGGMAIFTQAKGGLMYEAAVGGQKFKVETP